MTTEQQLKERAEARLTELFSGNHETYIRKAVIMAMIDFHKQELSGKEIYEAVEIKDGCEMPEKQGRYGVIRKNGEMSSRYYYGGIKEFNNQESLSHWLKKTTIKAISK